MYGSARRAVKCGELLASPPSGSLPAGCPRGGREAVCGHPLRYKDKVTSLYKVWRRAKRRGLRMLVTAVRRSEVAGFAPLREPLGWLSR